METWKTLLLIALAIFVTNAVFMRSGLIYLIALAVLIWGLVEFGKTPK